MKKFLAVLCLFFGFQAQADAVVVNTHYTTIPNYYSNSVVDFSVNLGYPYYYCDPYYPYYCTRIDYSNVVYRPYYWGTSFNWYWGTSPRYHYHPRHYHHRIHRPPVHHKPKFHRAPHGGSHMKPIGKPHRGGIKSSPPPRGGKHISRPHNAPKNISRPHKSGPKTSRPSGGPKKISRPSGGARHMSRPKSAGGASRRPSGGPSKKGGGKHR